MFTKHSLFSILLFLIPISSYGSVDHVVGQTLRLNIPKGKIYKQVINLNGSTNENIVNISGTINLIITPDYLTRTVRNRICTGNVLTFPCVMPRCGITGAPHQECMDGEWISKTEVVSSSSYTLRADIKCIGGSSRFYKSSYDSDRDSPGNTAPINKSFDIDGTIKVGEKCNQLEVSISLSQGKIESGSIKLHTLEPF